MAGPWEKFQAQDAPAGDNSPKPWEKFESSDSYGPAAAAKQGLEAANKYLFQPFNKYIAKPLDSVTGAPFRAYLGTASKGGGLMDSLGAAAHQFGNQTKEAPTGKDILKNNGLGDTASAIGGPFVDVLTDPTMLLPMGEIARAGKTALGTVKEASGIGRVAKPIESGLMGLKEAAPAENFASKVANESINPSSLKDLEGIIAKSRAEGLSTDSPTFSEIEKLQKELSLDHPITNAQKEAYKSKNNYNIYNAYKLKPSEGSQVIQDYEALQRGEGTKKLNDLVSGLTKGGLSKNEVNAGENTLKDFISRYENTRAENIPEFKAIDAMEVPPNVTPNLLTKNIGKELGIDNYFLSPKDDFGHAGVAKLLPYSPKMGISKDTYNTINEVLDTVGNNQLSIKEIRNIREAVRGKAEAALGSGNKKDYANLQGIRKSLMNTIEELGETQLPNNNIKQVFKNWAVNEKNKEMMEQALGGSLDKNSMLTKQIKPEDVLGRVFSNTNSVKLAKDTLGDEAFARVRADFINGLLEQSKKAGGLSAQSFNTQLKKNASVLVEAFKDDPAKLSQIESLSNFLRLVPDMATPNPSGTAMIKTIMESLNEVPGGNASKMAEALSKIPTTKHGLLKAALEKFGAKSPDIKQQEIMDNLMQNAMRGEGFKYTPPVKTKAPSVVKGLLGGFESGTKKDTALRGLLLQNKVNKKDE